jgi:uncharacterized protein (DUF433 family)
MTLREIEAGIRNLTPAEKRHILDELLTYELTGEAPSGIDRNAGVMGGAACIVRTRIPVWLLVQLRQMGMREAEILSNYPTLRASDLINAWAYAALYPDEIAEEMRAQADD